ncbi:C6 zinc finger domain-containing protein [Arthroderma uncinatum]|uniref:C6 zinc finger domain-containing protein n=1 Tax=Arthroderma uncinatum TaxID=74035 RepID=UPI00144A6C63|nr:C6 zinc finger domain-containing protein [Arthroderma uncinatum]KAF3480695.1 C6 zinc finger domain-containing protein [Arthroderma uncinatum]
MERESPDASIEDERTGSTLPSTSSTSLSRTATQGGSQFSYPFTETSDAHKMIMKSSNCRSIVLAFLSDYFPPDQPHLCITPDDRPWTHFLTQLPTKCQALESAGVAIAAAGLGRLHGIPQLIRVGMRFYTEGLQQLQASLWDKNLMLRDETLTTSLSPAILQKTTYLPRLGPQQKVELARRLVQEYWELDRKLDDVYAHIQSTGPSPLYWRVLAELRNPTDTKEVLFPIVYRFPDLKTAWVMMTYWATRLMFWTGLCDLYELIEGIQPEAVDDSPSPESADDAAGIDN